MIIFQVNSVRLISSGTSRVEQDGESHTSVFLRDREEKVSVTGMENKQGSLVSFAAFKSAQWEDRLPLPHRC